MSYYVKTLFTMLNLGISYIIKGNTGTDFTANLISG